MSLSRLPQLCVLLMVSACFTTSTLMAQEIQDANANEDSEAPVREKVELTPEEEAAAADLREAINENLVPDRPRSDPSEAPGEDESLEEVAAPSTPPQSGSESINELEKEIAEEEEDPFWSDRFMHTVDNLQTLPERLPGLAGRGWIHFGRIELEAAHLWIDPLESDSGFNFRSLRGGLVRQFSDSLLVKLELDATDGDSNWTDLYARYNTRLGVFTLGNQKIAQTLVDQTSRLSRTFLEKPLPADAFGLSRRLGVGWDLKLPRVGAHLTAFGPDLNENIGKFGYGFRLHTNPDIGRFNMVHFGASAVQERMDRDAQFRAYPETRVTSTRLVDTGRVEDVETQSIFGGEFAVARKSMSLRTEVFFARWDREGGETNQFNGYYAQFNWALTGEQFQYAQGKFLRLKPERRNGAWELGVRFSQVNLNDDTVEGGQERNLSLALNWYGPGQQLRAMGGIIYVNTDEVAGDVDGYIGQLRVQFHW